MKSHTLPQTHLFAFIIGAAFLLAGLPLSAHAATTKPSCELNVTVGSEDTRITKDGDVIIPEDGSLTIEWSSENADEAELDGDEVDTSGEDNFSPEKKTTYEFEFKKGSRKATCEVTVHVADGSIDDVTDGSKPTLSGKADGLKKVNVAIYKEGSSKKIFEKKNVSVKRGEWSVKVSKTLAEGEYEVRLTGDRKYDLNGLTTATLTIDDDENTVSASGKSNLTLSTLPLLTGGNTRANANVPIIYLQVRNAGKEASRVTGFTVKQNGSASTNVITSLSTVDDKGGSRGVSRANPFSNGTAFVATDAVIEPGAVKLFTIKAQLGANVSIGSNLMLDVVGIESNGVKKSGFQLKGTTWTIGY